MCVNEAEVDVAELAPPKLGSVSHRIVYVSEAWSPDPPSVDAVHVQSGVVSVVGVVAEGVPGVEGTVVSMVTFGVVALNATHEEHAESSSQAFTCHLYPVASERVATVLVAVNAVEE